MTVLVAVPYFNAAPYIDRAVRSILAQTERDLCLMVLGDGEEPPLAKVRDSRLVVHTMARNHGNYFARQVMLLANPHPWYAPHDADDWSDPNHLEVLSALGSDAVHVKISWWHMGSRFVGPHDGRLHIGLYGTERLRAFGGYSANERVGQDSMLLHLVRLTGPTVDSLVPTYHRVKRPGSLTTLPESNHRSLARAQMKRRNRETYIRAHEMEQPELIRAYRERLLPPEVRDALAREVEAVSAKLGQPVVAA